MYGPGNNQPPPLTKGKTNNTTIMLTQHTTIATSKGRGVGEKQEFVPQPLLLQFARDRIKKFHWFN